jgi:hypothetical protein
MNYAALVETNARFLEMLIPEEHIYLFSDHSVTSLFHQIGAEYIQFEPAIFGIYDMFFAVSRTPFQTNTPEQIESALMSSSNGRLALASLDLRERELDLMRKLQESDADRAARWTQIETLTKMVKESEADRVALGEQNASLTADLNALLARPVFRWLTRLSSWPELKNLAERIGKSNE